jgi:tetratricopeptide (TPR) repeat protein
MFVDRVTVYRAARLLLLALALVLPSVPDPAAADTVQIPADYPPSLERDLKALQESQAKSPADPQVLVKLASVYLDLGEDLYTDKEAKRASFEEGARWAKRALEIQEANAEAHYLYAANLGSAADTKGVAASLMALDEIKSHARRAIELNKDHVAALHMAGMMLEELPSFMGGNKHVALDYVKRAAALDPNYSHARLDLAKMYVKRRDQESAKRELQAIVAMEHPTDAYPWQHRYRAEAEKLLATLKPAESAGTNGK